MDRLKKQFVMLVIPGALFWFASLLAAQGPPNPCVNACWQAYTDGVKTCHGDPTCLATARAAAVACGQGCGLPRKSTQLGR